MSDEVRRLAQRWSKELAGVEFAVEDVPAVNGATQVPLGRVEPGPPTRIIIHRRPVEARGGTADERELARLVRDVIIEEVADLLGLSPESIDPSYDGD